MSYVDKHNEANGENGRDGHGDNHSDNMGVEGPTADPAIIAGRARRKRNLMATLMLSQGTPMLLAGDEMGNTQSGNNNAYSQDNEISWIDWDDLDPVLHAFTRMMIEFRRDHPLLRQKLFLHARERAVDGFEDLFWWRPDGAPMADDDWTDAELRCIAMELRMASGTPAYAETENAIFAVFNAGDAVTVKLPEPIEGADWIWRIDTSRPDGIAAAATASVEMPADSVSVFVLDMEPQ